MATEAEYGPQLRARFRRFVTGVGPVEAGVHLAGALARAPVDLVVSLGSAGSARLDQGSVYQVSAVAYREALLQNPVSQGFTSRVHAVRRGA